MAQSATAHIIPTTYRITTLQPLYSSQAMASQQWYRVARGLQMVAESALSQTTTAAGATSARAAEHATDLARNARVAAEQANAAAAAAAAGMGGSRSDAWTSSSSYGVDKTPSSFDRKAAAPPTKDTASHGEAPPVAESLGSPASPPPVHEEPESASTGSPNNIEIPNVQLNAQLPQSNHFDDAHTTTLAEGRPVPSTRVGRAFGFATLGVGLAAGTVVCLNTPPLRPTSTRIALRHICVECEERLSNWAKC